MMRKRLFFLLLFSTAMAYVEAMVVVYLRRLVPAEVWGRAGSYAELSQLIRDAGIMWSEQTREFATIIMLAAVAYLFGRSLREKWVGFLISFGVWDIFYYFFLYLWLRWPPGPFTRDVLFLIPLPWVAPVFIPVMISCLMIVWGCCVLRGCHRIGK
jgi:hypothetical protein